MQSDIQVIKEVTKKIMEKLSIYTEDENIHTIKILLIIIHVFTYYLQSSYSTLHWLLNLSVVASVFSFR